MKRRPARPDVWKCVAWRDRRTERERGDGGLLADDDGGGGGGVEMKIKSELSDKKRVVLIWIGVCGVFVLGQNGKLYLLWTSGS